MTSAEYRQLAKQTGTLGTKKAKKKAPRAPRHVGATGYPGMDETRAVSRSVTPSVFIKGLAGMGWPNDKRRPYSGLVARAIRGEELTQAERAALSAECPASVALYFHEAKEKDR